MSIVLILFSGLSVYLFICGFIGPVVIEKLIYRRRISDIRNRNIRDLYNKYQADNTLMKNLLIKFQPLIEKMSKKDTEKAEKKYKETAQLLYSAGISIEPSTYMFIEKLTYVVALILAGFLAVILDEPMAKMYVFLIAAAAPYILFRFSVKSKVTYRKNLISRQLPDILDLLSISVDAGMGFDQALDYVVKNMDGPLIDELTITTKEMGLGRTRKDAFKNLSERLEIESVTNFASAVVQATEMGISMRDVLKTQAEVARTTRVNEVKAKAAKASIKMLIPMVCFIFPVLFIILMGPAAISMMQNGGLG